MMLPAYVTMSEFLPCRDVVARRFKCGQTINKRARPKPVQSREKRGLSLSVRSFFCLIINHFTTYTSGVLRGAGIAWFTHSDDASWPGGNGF
jgi:hypothetical protein